MESTPRGIVVEVGALAEGLGGYRTSQASSSSDLAVSIARPNRAREGVFFAAVFGFMLAVTSLVLLTGWDTFAEDGTVRLAITMMVFSGAVSAGFIKLAAIGRRNAATRITMDEDGIHARNGAPPWSREDASAPRDDIAAVEVERALETIGEEGPHTRTRYHLVVRMRGGSRLLLARDLDEDQAEFLAAFFTAGLVRSRVAVEAWAPGMEESDEIDEEERRQRA